MPHTNPAPQPNSAPAPQQILDQDGKPIPANEGSDRTTAVLDMLALGAGVMLLFSASKSRSMVGGLIKGGAAAALLGRAAKNAGALGKVASVLQGAPRARGR